MGNAASNKTANAN
uniref:Uncharacterized protein n=1 Tax=Anguilla anguilla TaxID=7936 RepID=A0A0E9VMR5_ANGAN